MTSYFAHAGRGVFIRGRRLFHSAPLLILCGIDSRVVSKRRIRSDADTDADVDTDTDTDADADTDTDTDMNQNSFFSPFQPFAV